MGLCVLSKAYNRWEDEDVALKWPSPLCSPLSERWKRGGRFPLLKTLIDNIPPKGPFFRRNTEAESYRIEFDP